MMTRLKLFSVATLAIGLVAQGAQAQVKLELKYPERTAKVTTTINVHQIMTVDGMTSETNSNTMLVAERTTQARGPDGTVKILEKIKELQSHIEIPGMDYQFDSANPDAAGTSLLESIRPLHKKMIGSINTTLVGADNHVVSVSLPANLLDGLDPLTQQAVKSELDAERLKKTMTQEINRFPKEPVTNGQSWERTEEIGLGSGQIMTFQNRYTYEGEQQVGDRTLDKIAIRTTSVDFRIEGAALPFNVTDSKLEVDSSEGQLLFDRAKGVVASQESKIRIVGSITLEAMGNERTADLDLEMENKVVVTE